MDMILKPICKVLNFIYQVLLYIAAASLLAIVLIISAHVFIRQFTGGTLRWGQEVALLLMVWMAFITCAMGVERGLHIGIEMFYNHFPKILQKIFFYINSLLVIVVGVMFTVYGWGQTISTTTSRLPSTGWPKCVMYAIIPISGIFIIYFGLLKMFRREDLLPKPLFFEKPEEQPADLREEKEGGEQA